MKGASRYIRLQSILHILATLGGGIVVYAIVWSNVMLATNNYAVAALGLGGIALVISLWPLHAVLRGSNSAVRVATPGLALLSLGVCGLLGWAILAPSGEHWRIEWKLQLMPGVRRAIQRSYDGRDFTYIRFSQATDSDVHEALPLMLKLGDVEDIWLVGQREVSDKALEDLGELSRLRRLEITGTPINGHGFRHLVGLPNLEELYALNCPIDDAGLVHLRECRSLRTLHFSSPYISIEAIDMLTAALPNCEVAAEVLDAPD